MIFFIFNTEPELSQGKKHRSRHKHVEAKKGIGVGSSLVERVRLMAKELHKKPYKTVF